MEIEHLPLILGWVSAIAGIVLTIFSKYKAKHIFDHPFIYGSVLGVFILIAGNEWLSSVDAYKSQSILRLTDIQDDIKEYLTLGWLIISFAYLAHSLDKSGFFEFCANKIVLAWGDNKWKLYISLYFLVSILTFFTTNDIVILSMTTIVIYIGRRLEIKNMIPFLLMQYYAANIVSMGLYIGSPTNVVIGDKVGWSFFEYARNMMIPTITSFLAGGLILSAIFSMQINKIDFNRKISPALKGMNIFDFEMGYKVAIFMGLLVILSYDSLDKNSIEIWQICLFFSGIAIASDIVLEVNRRRRFLFVPAKKIAIDYFSDAVKSMPWTIIPFLLSMGILVHGLSFVGLNQIYLNWVEDIAGVTATASGGTLLDYIKLSVAHGLASTGLVNTMNDIPSSLFIADVMEKVNNNYPDGMKNMVIVSSLIGLNPGVGVSLSGALAGLMWMTILRTHSSDSTIFPSVKQLSIYGVPSMLFIVIVTCIINGVVYYFN